MQNDQPTMVIEFRRPDSDGGSILVAKLQVNGDGSHSLTGGEGLDLTSVTIVDRASPSGKWSFDANPIEWARSVKRAFRSPYLVPVIVEDTFDRSTDRG